MKTIQTLRQIELATYRGGSRRPITLAMKYAVVANAERTRTIAAPSRYRGFYIRKEASGWVATRKNDTGGPYRNVAAARRDVDRLHKSI
jgi:hypothetical protein